METLGEKIYRLRKQNGYSQEELGFMLEVSRQTISQWESNVLQPKYDKFKKLCELFKVSPDYFISSKNKIETEVIDSSLKIENLCNVEPPEKFKLPAKAKALIITAVVFLIVSVICLVLTFVTLPQQKGFETVTSVTVNFSLANIMIIISVTSLVVVISLLIALVIAIKRQKKQNVKKK